jgi:ABC-type polysaccharide/polyol phosphate export permease
LRKDLSEELSHPAFFFSQWLGALVQCLIYYYLAKVVDTAAPHYRTGFTGGYFFYFIVGMAMHQFSQRGLTSFVAAFRQEVASGTLEYLWLGRLPPMTLLFSMSLWPFLNGLFHLAVFFVIGGLLSPAVFIQVSLFPLFAAVLFTFFLYVPIGLMGIAITLMTKRGEGWTGLFGSVNLALAGVLFPVSFLPRVLQSVSEVLPLTHVLRLVRSDIAGRPPNVLYEIGFLLLLAALLYGAAFFCLQTGIRRAETEGSLIHV